MLKKRPEFEPVFGFLQEGELVRTASFADDGEILDGMITRSRGEIRHMCSPKVTSSTGTTPSKEFKSIESPRFPEKVYSPRISQLRGELSPGNRGPFSPRANEKPSSLGKG